MPERDHPRHKLGEKIYFKLNILQETSNIIADADDGVGSHRLIGEIAFPTLAAANELLRLMQYCLTAKASKRLGCKAPNRSSLHL